MQSATRLDEGRLWTLLKFLDIFRLKTKWGVDTVACGDELPSSHGVLEYEQCVRLAFSVYGFSWEEI